MPFVDLAEIPVWERLPGWRGRVFDSESMSFAHWEFAKGSAIHEHRHPNEEVWTILAGELEVTIAGETRRAGPGQVAIVPAGAPHAVRALSDGRALVVDWPLRPDQRQPYR